jgi:hypothetical protein
VRLVEGLETREAADRWAAERIAYHEASKEPGKPGWDEGVWKALLNLFGSDLKISNTDYLHGAEDFRAWLEEFDRSDPGQAPRPG